MAAFEYTHHRRRGSGLKTLSRLRIKKREREREKRGEKQHLHGTPVFFNLLCIHLPSSRLNTLFSEILFILERDSRSVIPFWIC